MYYPRLLIIQKAFTVPKNVNTIATTNKLIDLVASQTKPVKTAATKIPIALSISYTKSK